jgi:hypothetical protein
MEYATPRPWQVEYHEYDERWVDGPKYANSGACMIYAVDDCDCHPVADVSCNYSCRDTLVTEANAALIVKAVNNYDIMHQALTEIASFAPEVTHGWAEHVRHVARKGLGDE